MWETQLSQTEEAKWMAHITCATPIVHDNAVDGHAPEAKGHHPHDNAFARLSKLLAGKRVMKPSHEVEQLMVGAGLAVLIMSSYDSG